MPDQRKPTALEQAASKATSIGPRQPKTMEATVPDSAYADDLRRLRVFLQDTLADPLNLGQDSKGLGMGGGVKAIAAGAGTAEGLAPVINAGKALMQRLEGSGASGAATGTFEHLPSQLTDALHIAQQRWPRLFGHLTDVKVIDPAGTSVAGQTLSKGRNMSMVKLNPSLATTETVGHELLHHADNVALGTRGANANYEFSRALPGGYNVQSQEIRARNMGDRMTDIVGAVKRNAAETGQVNPKVRVAPSDFMDNVKLKKPFSATLPPPPGPGATSAEWDYWNTLMNNWDKQHPGAK